jgi:hypothetical protein
MKMPFPCLMLSLFLVISLAACNMPQTRPGVDAVATSVAQTLAAPTQIPQLPLATPNLEQPTNTPSPTGTSGPTETPVPGFGSIAGNLGAYPYGAVPALVIVAFGQEPPYRYWYLLLPAGGAYYSMDGYITTGKYQVVAYDASGHAGGCTVIVEVLDKKTVTCDILTWSGSYPAKPSGVPNP